MKAKCVKMFCRRFQGMKLNHTVKCSCKMGAALGSLPRTAHLIKNFAQRSYHRILSPNQNWIKIYKEMSSVHGVQATQRCCFSSYFVCK